MKSLVLWRASYPSSRLRFFSDPRQVPSSCLSPWLSQVIHPACSWSSMSKNSIHLLQVAFYHNLLCFESAPIGFTFFSALHCKSSLFLWEGQSASKPLSHSSVVGHWGLWWHTSLSCFLVLHYVVLLFYNLPSFNYLWLVYRNSLLLHTDLVSCYFAKLAS